MKVTICRRCYTQRPNSGAYIKQCSNNETVETTVADLALKISRGMSFHGGVYDLRPDDNIAGVLFESTDTLVLDIDNKEDSPYPYCSFDDMKTKLLDMGLRPCMMYPSFSSTDDRNKYRVIFRLNETIYKDNVRKREILMEMLATVFPFIDMNCKNRAHAFYGTNKPIEDFYIDEEATLDEIVLFQQFDHMISGNRKAIKKKLADCARMWAIPLNQRGAPVVDFDDETHTIQPRFIEGYASTVWEDVDNPELARTYAGQLPQVDVDIPAKKEYPGWHDKLLRISRLYKDFCSGVPLPYMRRFFLFLNLNRVSGGESKMREVLIEHNTAYEHEFSHYGNQISKWKRHLYNPMRLGRINYTEHYDDWLARSGASTLVEALSDAYHYLPKHIPEPDTSIPANEAHDILKAHFYRCLDEDDNKVYGIKAGVGVGKTEIYVNYDYSRFNKVLIVVPTHQLAKEVESRMTASGINSGNIVRRPQRPEIPDVAVSTNYKKWLKMGAYVKSEQVYHEYFRTHPTEEYQRYKEAEAQAHSKKITISTHSHALYTHHYDDYDLVIIDEDIMNNFIEIKSVKYSDLKLFFDNCNNDQMQEIGATVMQQVDEARQERLSMSDSMQDHVFSTTYHLDGLPEYDISAMEFDDTILENLPDAEVLHFMQSKAYCINGENNHANGNSIFYSVVRPFNFRCKAVILSATLSEETFRKYYEGVREVEYFVTDRVKNIGPVKQDLRYSCSSKKLENCHKQIIQYVKDNVTDWNAYKVITFRKYVEKFRANGFQIACDEDGNDIYFGNLMGIDNLKGENLLVIGKYSPPEQYYRLYADALDYDTSRSVQTVCNATINQHETKLYQFTDDTLARLQREKIEAEMTQAIGRARTARTNATVYVFCDMPLDIADITTHNFFELKNIRGDDTTLGVPTAKLAC